MKNALGLILVFGLPVIFSPAAHTADEIFRPTHGGEVVKKSGLSYEVVRKPKEILVYPEKEAPVPNEITMKFKDKKGNINELRLKLFPVKETAMNIYSAPVPAKVYIAGGVSFDLGFSKKK